MSLDKWNVDANTMQWHTRDDSVYDDKIGDEVLVMYINTYGAYLTNADGPDDVQVNAQWYGLRDTVNHEFLIGLRVNPSTLVGYWIGCVLSATAYVNPIIAKGNIDSLTSLDTGTLISNATRDVVEFEAKADGTSLTLDVYVDGTLDQSLSATDSDHTSGKVGFGRSNDEATQQEPIALGNFIVRGI